MRPRVARAAPWPAADPWPAAAPSTPASRRADPRPSSLTASATIRTPCPTVRSTPAGRCARSHLRARLGGPPQHRHRRVRSLRLDRAGHIAVVVVILVDQLPAARAARIRDAADERAAAGQGRVAAELASRWRRVDQLGRHVLGRDRGRTERHAGVPAGPATRRALAGRPAHGHVQLRVDDLIEQGARAGAGLARRVRRPARRRHLVQKVGQRGWQRRQRARVAHLHQRGVQLGRGHGALVAIALERRRKRRVQLRRQVRPQLRRARQRHAAQVAHDLLGVVAGKQALAGQHLVDDRAGREHVGARVQVQAAGLLGRHVAPLAHDAQRARHVEADRLGDAEVADLRLAGAR